MPVRDLPGQIQKRARAKLLMIDAAVRLDDLRIPPANRLEALRGNRKINTASASTISGGFVLNGELIKPGM